VSSIGDAAFYLCQQLHGAYFLGDEPSSVQSLAFQNAAQDFTVYYIQGKTGFSPPPPGPWVPSGNANLGSYPTAYWRTFLLMPSAGAHGTISPGTATTVLQGRDASFTITPSAGHHIADVLVDGVSQGATTTYTFVDVEASHTISATFAADAPSDPYSVTYGPSGGGTLVQWAGSAGATGYQIQVNGVVVGTTGAAASAQFVHGLLGPQAHVTVTALGAEGTRSAAVAGVYSKSVAPVKVGTVHFAGNSAKLTPAGKRTLKRLAALITAQGFTNLRVNAFTAKLDHGSRSFRKRLSVRRASVVKSYLVAEFKRLHARVAVVAAGYGGAQPVGSNASPSGRAKNRRAELSLQ
jgi:outer membrane protein OmpA-like peptidoglycan-associated protein